MPLGLLRLLSISRKLFIIVPFYKKRKNEGAVKIVTSQSHFRRNAVKNLVFMGVWAKNFMGFISFFGMKALSGRNL